MPSQIPIGSILNAVSAAILLLIFWHLWDRTKEQNLLPLKVFKLFFLFLLIAVAVFALPALVSNNYLAIQFLYNVGSMVFMGAIAFLARFTALLTIPRRKLFTSHIPVSIAVIGIIVFFWQIIMLAPTIPSVIGTIADKQIVEFKDTSPVLSNIILGFISFTVFLTGTLLFLKTTFSTNNKLLRRRSLLLGTGHAVATLAVVANFATPQLFGEVAFLIIASILALISVSLIYLGILVRVKTYEQQI